MKNNKQEPSAPTDDAPPKPTFKGSHFRFIWELLTAYWRGNEKKIAWAFFSGVIILSTLQVHASVVFNYWHRDFFSSLEKVNWDAFLAAVLQFPLLVVYLISAFLGSIYLNAQMTIRWRRWMTEHFLEKWLRDNTFYKLRLSENTPDNPDQRIAADLGAICGETLGLMIALYQAILTVGSFSIILWSLFGTLDLNLGSISLHIPGAMMWAALIYAIISSGVIWKVGYPLIGLDFAQEKKEANFRYSLMRLRERAPEASLMTHKEQEELVYGERFSSVIQNFYQILRRRMILNVWLNLVINTSSLFPFFIAAPKFFAGNIAFGVLMQISQAFRTVETSFSFIVHNFSTIASWRASIDRVVEFDDRMEGVRALVQKVRVKTVALGQNLVLDKLSLFKPSGQVLLKDVCFKAPPAKWTALKGPSGLGKSTLIQTIAGHWPFAGGTIEKPGGVWLYAPQKPYFPLLSLKEILVPGLIKERIFHKGTSKSARQLSMRERALEKLAPSGLSVDTLAEEKLSPEHKAEKLSAEYKSTIEELFEALELTHLLSHLDDRIDWNNTLSLGEQQRLSLIRVMLRKPDWIMLDEPTASLDAPLARAAYGLLKEKCPKAGVVVVSHSPEVDPFIDLAIDLTRFASEEALEEARQAAASAEPAYAV